MMFSSIILAAGYKRTGKDTLYSCLQSGFLGNWKVYCRRDNGIIYPKLFESMPKLEVSTAVIQEFTSRTGISITEENKESHRLELIEIAETRKLQDPSYWIHQCLLSAKGSKNIYISGFRFPLEYEYCKNNSENCISVRVFRKEVPIPSEPQEHGLDEFPTDFLFLGLDTELEDVVSIFPQYTEYISCI